MTNNNNCACGKQIVWFLNDNGLGSVIVCKDCEKTFYYDVKICPSCNKPTTEFIEVEK